MLNTNDILETISMIENENLDIRTVTMGISLLDCIDPDIDKACEKVYNKITRTAKDLVPVCCQIERELGIPIINKRISVTPIAMILAACEKKEPIKFALALEKAAQAVGVNFIGLGINNKVDSHNTATAYCLENITSKFADFVRLFFG